MFSQTITNIQPLVISVMSCIWILSNANYYKAIQFWVFMKLHKLSSDKYRSSASDK